MHNISTARSCKPAVGRHHETETNTRQHQQPNRHYHGPESCNAGKTLNELPGVVT